MLRLTKQPTFVRALLAAVCLVVVSARTLRAQQALSFGMWEDPTLITAAPVPSFSSQLRDIWIRALQEPTADVRRRACYTITLAHRRGVKGLEAAVPHLKRIVESESESSLVRLEAALALVRLDEKSAGPALLALVKQGFLDFTVTLEPALAKWKVPGAKELWLERVRTGRGDTARQVAALSGLRAIKATESVADVRKLLTNQRLALAVRVAAAQTLGELASEKLVEDLAASLSGKTDFADRYLVVQLIGNSRQASFLPRLKAFTEDKSPVIQGVALEALLQRDRKWVAENATSFLIRREPRICMCGLRAIADDVSESALKRVARRLNNRYSDVRRLARSILEDHAGKPKLRAKVLAVIDTGLVKSFGNRWQGLEQVALLIGRLKAGSKAKLLESMLAHERPEVATTSCWAIGLLARPETFPEVLRQATILSGRYKANDLNMEATEQQFAHLLHAFAHQRYEPAVPLLTRLVPKNLMIGAKARAVAVWCLGKYYEGKQNDALCRQLVERLEDINVAALEATEVRTMCAVALGRMKTRIGQESLEKFREDKNPIVRAACFWALNKRDGAKIPAPKSRLTGFDDWFIQSLTEAGSKTDTKAKKK